LIDCGFDKRGADRLTLPVTLTEIRDGVDLPAFLAGG
jgi:hypothetical protein